MVDQAIRAKVTIVLPRNYGVAAGGYKVAYEYANRLARRGWTVTVAHIARFDRRDWHRPWNNWGRTVRPSRPKWFALDDSVQSLQWARWSSRVVANAQVIIATSWQTAELVGHDPRGLYLIQHYEDWDGDVQRVDATWRLPLRKLVIAQWLAEKSIELDAGEVVIVPNAINPDIFSIDTAPEERSVNEVAMLWHQKAWKGADDGLQALEIVRQSHPDLHVTVFSTSARPSHLPPWVSFVRRANEAQLRVIYNKAAVFVCPSHTEGWGLPSSEAMACGAALVTTDNDGMRDFTTDGVTALVTPVADPKALADAVTTLLDDDELRCRIAHAGHDRIANSLNWENSTNILEGALRARIDDLTTSAD